MEVYLICTAMYSTLIGLSHMFILYMYVSITYHSVLCNNYVHIIINYADSTAHPQPLNKQLPHTYKFSRNVMFVDQPISVFFIENLIFSLRLLTCIMSLENLSIYGMCLHLSPFLNLSL